MGKGCYAWTPSNILGGNVRSQVAALVAAKVDHVAVKIHNGTYVLPDLERYIFAYQSAGIKVGVWGYSYLKWAPLSEAKAAALAFNRYRDLAYYLIDAESHSYFQFAGARIFAEALRRYLPNTPIGLNSWWKPSFHPSFPFAQLRAKADFDCPQVYWRGFDPIGKLKESRRQYSTMVPRLPYSMVAGDMYFEHKVKPTPGQVLEFLTVCDRDPEIEGVVMWSFDQINTTPDLWSAFASYYWGDGPKPRPILPPAKDEPLYAAVVTAYALNVRSGPAANFKKVGYYRKGDRLEVWKELANGWVSTNKAGDRFVHGGYIQKL
jgi:hypothetical protein